MTDLALKHGLRFPDLYHRDGLVRIDHAFVEHLAAADPALHNRLMTARRDPEALERADKNQTCSSSWRLMSRILSGELFGITAEITALQARHHELAPLYSVKRLFDRWAEDRAAAAYIPGKPMPGAVRANPRCGGSGREPRRPGHGRFWGVAEYGITGALGQEFFEDRAPLWCGAESPCMVACALAAR